MQYKLNRLYRTDRPNNINNCKTSIAHKSFKMVKIRGAPYKIRQKSSLEHGTDILWWKSNFKQICFPFPTKGVYRFNRFNRNRELIPNCWRSHRESTFANIKSNYRNNKLLANGWSKGQRCDY